MAILTDTSPCIPAAPGYRCRDGYASVWRDKRNQQAHRYAWEQVNGPIPKGLLVRHLCHNPECINVKHLTLGTMKDNRQDDRDVGKWESQQVLTEAQARDILAHKQTGKCPELRKHLAHKYNITTQTVGQIWNRKRWKHL